jgi:hypothetical protein
VPGPAGAARRPLATDQPRSYATSVLMSAIAALWYRHGDRDAGSDIDRMRNALAPYGPDRAGQRQDGHVALGA